MAWWAHCTKTGRVVYDRSVHKFAWCDAARIVRKLPDPVVRERSMGCFLAVLTEILAEIDRNPGFQDLPAPASEEALDIRELAVLMQGEVRRISSSVPEFGGGSFGGAGASRTFTDSQRSDGRPEGAPPPWLLPFYVPREDE